jgi:hypothetical protein
MSMVFNQIYGSCIGPGPHEDNPLSPACQPVRDRSKSLNQETDAATKELLLAPGDAKQLGAAIRTNSLNGSTTVFHRHFLRLGDFLLSFTLHTISFSHGIYLPLGSDFGSENLGRILLAASNKRQGAKLRQKYTIWRLSQGCVLYPRVV